MLLLRVVYLEFMQLGKKTKKKIQKSIKIVAKFIKYKMFLVLKGMNVILKFINFLAQYTKNLQQKMKLKISLKNVQLENQLLLKVLFYQIF